MSALTATRLNAYIESVRVKCDALDAEAFKALDASMDVDFAEHFAYQNAQASAHARGTLTPDAAMIVYRALGEQGSAKNGGWSSGTDLPTKVSVTLLMGELIAGRVRA